jgi:hypothetical protein
MGLPRLLQIGLLLLLAFLVQLAVPETKWSEGAGWAASVDPCVETEEAPENGSFERSAADDTAEPDPLPSPLLWLRAEEPGAEARTWAEFRLHGYAAPNPLFKPPRA